MRPCRLKQHLRSSGLSCTALSSRSKNVEYYDRFCAEFTDDEENKLAYTAIHNEYQQMVEDTIQQSLGPEK